MSVFVKDRDMENKLDEGRSAPHSAFLGPTLWDKTLPYDGDSFQLEYMDLEEFLSENGIPSSPAQQQQQQHRVPLPAPPTPIRAPPPPPSMMDLSSHTSTSVHNASPACLLRNPNRPGSFSHQLGSFFFPPLFLEPNVPASLFAFVVAVAAVLCFNIKSMLATESGERGLASLAY